MTLEVVFLSQADVCACRETSKHFLICGIGLLFSVFMLCFAAVNG